MIFHYYPYGEEITGTSNDTYKFAQTYRDSDSGLDYAQARYYNAGLGRFLTPDPSGSKAADPASPKTWSGYHYATNDPVNLTDPSGLLQAAPGGYNPCGPEGQWCDYSSNNDYFACFDVAGVGVCMDGGGSGPVGSGNDDEDQKPQSNCLSNFSTAQVNFVTAHYADSVSLGSQAGIPSTWVLGWSAQESGWGVQGAILRNPNNFFSWHGKGDARCPKGAIKVEGCFTSYYAAGSTALFSINNYFHYHGLPVHAGVSAGSILLNQYQSGASASQAFQTLANSGYVTNAGYGVSVSTDIGVSQQVEDCLSSLSMLPRLP